MPRGGARPHSGPKKGAKYKPTLEREAIVSKYVTRAMQDFSRLSDAQLETACGVAQIGWRDDHGRFKLAETEEEALAAQRLGKALTVYFRQPSAVAQMDILNRLMGKPVESHEHTGPGGGPLQVQWLP